MRADSSGRTVLFCLISFCRGVHNVLEQPAGSLMPRHPRMEMMEHLHSAGVVRWARAHLWMGMYGGFSPKPTWLWGTLWLFSGGCFMGPAALLGTEEHERSED
eukprot:9856956-Alexandrium_andersonii.AAC.1